MSTLESIVASLRTDRGRVHDHNEDFVACWEPATVEEEAKNGWFYIVADGVGGADAGEVASQYAVEHTLEQYLNSDEPEWGRRLLTAMQSANTALRQLVADQRENRRMATTMVAAVIHDQQVHIGNVGDSRAYLWRQGGISQVTEDQSLVNKLVKEGAITEAEAVNHPYQNVILYSIGSENHAKIDLFELPLEPADILVLCSDGLTKHLADEEIGDIVAHQDPDRATETLIRLANERGGKDNISVAVIHYKVPPPAVAATSQTRARQATGTVVAVPSQDQTSSSYQATLLWLYTIFLSLVQAGLIFIAWLLLRV